MDLALVLALILSCGGESETVETDKQAEFVPKPPSFDERLSTIRRKIGSGHAESGLEMAIDLLKNKPEREDIWRLALYSCLNSTDPKGAFQSLAELEIKPPDELILAFEVEVLLHIGALSEAATVAAKMTDAGQSAGYMARAAMKGAPNVMAAATDDSPKSKLIQATQASPSSSRALLEVASSLEAWQAQAVIAEVALEHGHEDLAKGALEKLNAVDSNQVKLKAILIAIGQAEEKESAVQLIEEGLGIVDIEGDVQSGIALGGDLERFFLRTGDSGGLWKKTEEIFKVDELQKAKIGSWQSVVVAKIALATGRLDFARELMRTARIKAEADLFKQQIAWIEGFASFALRDLDGLNEMLEQMTGENKTAMNELLRLASGQPMQAAGIALRRLDDRLFVQLALLVSDNDHQAALALLPEAIQKADDLKDLNLQVSTRMALEAHHRLGDGKNTIAELDEISNAFPDMKNLQTEISVRRYLQTGSYSAVSDDPVSSAWKMYASGLSSETAPKSLVALNRVAELSDVLQLDKRPSSAVNALWSSTPIHRVGPLSLGSALDGSQGLRMEGMVLKGVDEKDEHKVAALLVVQEIGRKLISLRAEVYGGRNPILGMEKDKLGPLLGSAAEARVKIVDYWLGADYPDDAIQALAARESELNNAESPDPHWAAFALTGKMDLESVREKLKKVALISYQYYGDDIIAIALSPSAAAIRKIGKTKEIQSLLLQHQRLLEKARDDVSVYKAHSTNHLVGDKLRRLLLDQFSKETYGYARYMLIAPEALLETSLSTLPDQQQGLRFIGELRTITVSSGLSEVMRASSEFGTFTPMILAYGAPESKGEGEDEQLAIKSTAIQVVMQSFRSDTYKVFLGDKAEVETYSLHAPRSRYLFFSEVDPSPDGGFELADGTLTLSQIHQTPLTAQVVFISAGVSSSVQIKRAEAFLNAGARVVVCLMWSLPEQTERLMMDKLFESLNRDDPLTLAVSKAREAYLKQSSRASKLGGNGVDKSDFVSNPGIWGTFQLFGTP
jgi:hypothetical protein